MCPEGGRRNLWTSYEWRVLRNKIIFWVVGLSVAFKILFYFNFSMFCNITSMTWIFFLISPFKRQEVRDGLALLNHHLAKYLLHVPKPWTEGWKVLWCLTRRRPAGLRCSRFPLIFLVHILFTLSWKELEEFCKRREGLEKKPGDTAKAGMKLNLAGPSGPRLCVWPF